MEEEESREPEKMGATMIGSARLFMGETKIRKGVPALEKVEAVYREAPG